METDHGNYKAFLLPGKCEVWPGISDNMDTKKSHKLE